MKESSIVSCSNPAATTVVLAPMSASNRDVSTQCCKYGSPFALTCAKLQIKFFDKETKSLEPYNPQRSNGSKKHDHLPSVSSLRFVKCFQYKFLVENPMPLLCSQQDFSSIRLKIAITTAAKAALIVITI